MPRKSAGTGGCAATANPAFPMIAAKRRKPLVATPRRQNGDAGGIVRIGPATRPESKASSRPMRDGERNRCSVSPRHRTPRRPAFTIPTRSCRRAIPYLPSTVTPESGGTERASNVASRFCLAEHGVDLRRLQSEVRAGGGGDRSTGGPGAIPLASGSRPAPRPDGGRLAGTGGAPANADLARNGAGHGRLDPPA